ncbi:MAG: protein-L-isoaspartate O-methyltransferase [Halobacteriales archaeon]|nr:protein-L-isoaspartate O-methyltransferase [Halobacteriales archaeon]
MDAELLRTDMVDSLEHEAKAVIASDAVASAMRTVPREPFVPDDVLPYADRAAEQFGTRVLAPSDAARLFEAVAPEPGDSVLVVGVGVGYTAAVLAELAGGRHVHAIDIDRRLVYEARSNLRKAGYSEVLVDCADGADGLPSYAPYDHILVEAAAIRPPERLLAQLSASGRLVLPLGGGNQTLTAVSADGERQERLGTVAFAPMLVDGEQATTLERNRTSREEHERNRQAATRKNGWEQEWIDWDRY